MRAIIFRGKDLADGEWVYGDLLHSATSCRIVNYNETEGDGYHDIDLDTVGQFTGYRDISGKEIYEGDILEYLVGIDSFGGIFRTVRIEYRVAEGGWVGIIMYTQTLDKREIVQNIIRCLNKCRIVGNIHDSAES